MYVAFRLIHDVVNGDDVGVIQAGSGLRFLDEAAAALRIAGFRAGQDLDRDDTVQPRVLGLVDIAHAAGAQFFKELIMRNDPANELHCFCPPNLFSVSQVGYGCASRFGGQHATSNQEARMDKLHQSTRKEKEDSLAPDDPRPDWMKEDNEMENRKPELAEIEEDTSELE